MIHFLETQTPQQIEALRAMLDTMHPKSVSRKDLASLTKFGKKPKKDRRGEQTNGSTARGPMRALNSFIAFRSYYSSCFRNYQQKDISVFVNRMWLADFFKPKWTIVAKAYSIIRDRVGKANAPLDKFLAVACPAIGILTPDEYFKQMGWVLPTLERELGRLYTPDIRMFNVTTNLSPNDLVMICERAGYTPPVAPTSSQSNFLCPNLMLTSFNKLLFR